MDVGSSWWLQALFFVAINSGTYGLMQFWRHFPFSSIIVFTIITLVELPFVIVSENYPIHKVKFYILAPFLTFFTLWRIAYIPVAAVQNKAKWKLWLLQFARRGGKYVCCVKRNENDENKVINTTKCMEYFLWFVLWINILLVVEKSIKHGDYLNSTCGVILSFTIPIPAKLLYNRHSYYVQVEAEAEAEAEEEEKAMNWYKDVNVFAPLHWLWIITFTLWLWTFVWLSHTESIFLSSIHFIAPLVCLMEKKPSYFLQLRTVCITLFLYVRCPVAIFATFPWFLNGDNFPFWRDVVENHRYVFTILGAVNLSLSLIHLVIFIRNIYQIRKSDEDEKRKLDQQIQMQTVTVNEDEK